MQALKFTRVALSVVSVAALMACTSPELARDHGASMSAAAGSAFSFGLWGDMPYKKAGDDPKLPAVLQSINASDIAFSMYDGDIKDGSSKCTDDIYTDALKMFGTMKKPVVYVPGDNEWTDCHRINNGGMDGLERLSHLRKVMFPTLDSLGQVTMPLEHQGKLGAKFVENTRFNHGSITFVGINMPGSNNNLVLSASDCGKKSARKSAQCDAGNAEYLERDDANVAWLAESFAQAKAKNSRGLVLVVQSDPGFDLPETEEFDESTQPQVSGYRNFMSKLAEQTKGFKGEVLFVHGDTHFFKLDKPLFDPTHMLTNFTRLQTFGSPSLHWVKVKVDPASTSVFQVEPVMVKQPG
jgi:hypothetical protein